MKIASVTGSVVATRKYQSLVGCKLMIVRSVGSDGIVSGAEMVAVDYVGAGIGETVLLAQGSAVRTNELKRDCVIDLAIVGIIDTMNKS